MRVMTTRRGLLGAAAMGLSLPMLARAQGAAWPRRSVKLVIPFPPGGTTDLIGRLLAEKLSSRLGQTVVVENRSGAGGNIGAEAVAKAEPDGYTFLMASVGTAAINYAVYGTRMPFRPQDLAPVGLVTRVANVVLAANNSGITDIAGLLSRARAAPGNLNYGTAGIGSSTHACMELFQSLTKTQLQHVPYRGSGPMLTEVVAGRVQLGCDNIPTALNFIRDGQMRALAVTSAERSTVLPDVPTLREAGVAGFDATSWFGVQAPARTPEAVVARMGEAIDAIVREPEWNARMRDFAADPPRLTAEGGTTPAAFAAFIATEIARWAEVAQSSHMTVE
ncbi:tripartite tricarboxylate transporter substrate binding protein [Pseudoroseomonas wenyumeiae]|uniref:Tripartite tricarboxylate transporter substrate binding protein n=2 Tax=Teichococcus wenyumeiae TaxID=2478470 RepID=A0A3A9JKJ3_9PROT|nr:tripartite tricarboxylate transporter substrate binding protein [Pseudoroseomonas wenyumeiae]RMI24955.1 tripartite tricarboxylate transporter substrate binding protein [Pseudoroseomonas wenyumeiae]